jgi:putative transposase
MSHHFVNQLIHAMWSTNNQQHVISPHLKSDLYAYITAIIKAKNGKVFAIGGSFDHIHLLGLLPPDISLSTLLGHVKACSSKWIKTKKNSDPNFYLAKWLSSYKYSRR